MRSALLFLLGCSTQPAPSPVVPMMDASIPTIDAPTPTRAPIDAVHSILTQRVDNARTGAFVHETLLTPDLVKKGFRLRATRTVAGYTYAQPLFIPSLEIPGKKGKRDVVFVATEHDDVYAFDANDPEDAPPLWHVSLGTPILSTDFPFSFADILPELGITSTPVIDPASETLFVFAQTHEAGVFRNRIHALDVRTGEEKAVRDVDTSIDPVWTLQRPGLGFDRGILWIAGGGKADVGPYHGWIVALSVSTDGKTLEPRGRYLTTPNGVLGGIWQSGTGIAIDEDGAAYFETGNGTVDTTTDPPNIGDSFGKVVLGAKDKDITLVDWFTPHDQARLDAADLDLGSSGPVLLPGTKLAVGGGKEGKLYVLDRTAMGHMHADDDDQIVQSFQSGQWLFAAPIFWNSHLYTTVGGDPVRAYRLADGRFDEKPSMESKVVSNGPSVGALAISSNEDSSGIVWALVRKDGSDTDDGPGILHALDADDLSLLWSGDVGSQSKFVVPTIAGGKAFVPTADGRLLIFAP